MDRKRILVFGDSNSWGFVPNPTGDPTTRYDASTRWPRAMINRLGAGFELIEEGLSARTTNLDDPQFDIPSVHLKGAPLNGAMILPAILASHLPLDLVIIMLGSNDLKARFNRSASEIAQAVVSLAGLIADCKGGVATVYGSPQVLLVAPPALGADFATRRTGREASRRVWNSGRRSALQQQRLTCRFSMRAKLSQQMAATVSIFRRNPSGNWVKRSRRKFFSSSGIREQKFLANDRDHHGGRRRDR